MKISQALFVVTIPSLVFSTASWGFSLRLTESGDTVMWEQDSVVICLDESLSQIGDPKQVGDVIAEAFATWEGSGVLRTTFEFIECTSTGDPADGHDGRNVVSAFNGQWPYPSHANAVTLVTYDTATGATVDVDIIFDAGVNWSLTSIPPDDAYDLLDTATHEVGHAIGLEHSDVRQATMYAVTTPGSVRRRTLHDDDIAGVTAIYGVLPLGRTEAAGCTAVARRGSPGTTGVGFVFLFGALHLLIRAGRRRGLTS